MKQKILFNEVDFQQKNKLIELFNVEYFSIGKVTFCGDIIVAIVKFKSVKSLASNWDGLNGFITAEYVAKIENEFSKWNFYIIYVSSVVIEKHLKYEIENNKFSSRKIVVDEHKKSLSMETVNGIISKQITNENLLVTGELEVVRPLKKNPALSKIIDSIPLEISKKDREEILENAHAQIEKLFTK